MDAAKKENRIFEYILYLMNLEDIIDNIRKIVGRAIRYATSYFSGSNENGNTRRPDNDGRLTPHRRNNMNEIEASNLCLFK